MTVNALDGRKVNRAWPRTYVFVLYIYQACFKVVLPLNPILFFYFLVFLVYFWILHFWWLSFLPQLEGDVWGLSVYYYLFIHIMTMFCFLKILFWLKVYYVEVNISLVNISLGVD